MPQGGSFLDKLLLGIKAVWWNGTPVTPRPTINFLGGVVADNSGLGTTDVTLGGSSGGGGGVTTVESNGTAQPLRTAINFVGFDVTDDSPHNRTNVTLDLANSSITGVLSVPQGGTGAASFTVHAVLLGGGSGPITTVASSADGDVLTLAGGIPTWAVPAPGFTPGADLVTSTSSQQWVSSISGPNGDRTETAVEVDRLNFAVDADPTLGQDTTGQVLGESVVLGPQSGIDPSYTAGNVYHTVAASRSATSPRYEIVYDNAQIPMFALGPAPGLGTGYLGVWFFPVDSGVLPSSGNLALVYDSSGNVYQNAGYTFFGNGFFSFGFGGIIGGGNSIVLSQAGLNCWAGGGALNTGVGVMAIGNAATPANPVSNGTGSGVLESLGAGAGLHWLAPVHTGGIGSRSFDTTLGAAAIDDPATQQMANPKYLKLGTTTSNGTVVQTVTPPTGTFGIAGRFLITIVGRTTNAGSSGAVGDMCSFLITGSYKNVSSTVSVIGTPKELDSSFDTSHVGAAVAITASSATYLVTVTAATNAGAVVDWTILTQELTT